MPGFLSAYEGTHRIELGTFSGVAYWVDVKKCLSADEMARVEAALGAAKRKVIVRSNDDVDEAADLDYRAWRVEMVARSVVAWNLTDQNGGDLPLQPESHRRASISRLPSPVFDQIWKVCNDLNGQKEDPAERVSFPEPPVSGDQDGHPGPAGPPPVSAGTGVLAAPGPHPGSGQG